MEKQTALTELEQRLSELEIEREQKMLLEHELQEKSRFLIKTNESLQRAIRKANQMAADAETKAYQLQIEIQQRKQSENINRALFKISNAIHTTRDLKELYKFIHTTLMEVMDLSNFAIAIYEKNRDRCFFPYFVDRKEKTYPALYEVSKNETSLTREVIFSKKPVFKTRKKTFLGKGMLKETSLGLPAMAWVGVPLIIQGTVIGVLITQSYSDPDRYSLTDVDILISVSKQVGLAIETKRANTALLESENKYKSILSSIHEGYCEVDKEGFITFTNEALYSITGFSRRELLNMNGNVLIHPGDQERVLESLNEISDLGGHLTELNYRIIKKDKAVKYIGASVSLISEAGLNEGGLRFVIRDIDKRKKHEEELLHIAYHDALTGLHNRKAFYEHLEKARKKAKRNSNRVALIFIDIDKFKKVNDSLGHEAGDDVLVKIASRLTRSLRTTDFFARMGGDEFTIILDDHTRFNPARVAAKIAAELSKPYQIIEQIIDYVSASIGISIYPDDAEEISDLIRKADKAMYRAKKNKTGIVWANPACKFS